MNKDLKWPAVVVILGMVAALAFLSFYDKDVTPVLAGIIAVLGALGFGVTFNKQSETQQTVATIKEQTNGRMGDLMATVEQQRQDQNAANERHQREMSHLVAENVRTMKEMADKLAAMVPPEAVNPISGVGSGEGNASNL